MATMPAPTPDQARQQAVLALKTQLEQRLQAWRSARLTTEAASDCAFRIDYEQGVGNVTCIDRRDTAQLGALIQGLLRPLSTAHANTNLTCLRLTDTQLFEQACQKEDGRLSQD